MTKEVILNDKKVKINESHITGFRWEMGGKNVYIKLISGIELPVPKELVKQEGEKIILR